MLEDVAYSSKGAIVTYARWSLSWPINISLVQALEPNKYNGIIKMKGKIEAKMNKTLSGAPKGKISQAEIHSKVSVFTSKPLPWIHSNREQELPSVVLLLKPEISLQFSPYSSPSSPSSPCRSILHQVPEGHVGVYWRGGALLETVTDPGFHLKAPLITQYEPVQVTLQTDQVRDIPCGTKGGVVINFEKIEVVNRLRKEYVYDTLLNYGVQYDHTWIYDKIHHEINQFCSSHTLQQVYIDVFDQIDEKMKDALQGDCTRYAPESKS
ncbi:unnamed protein product [Dovyalis caffra]|uniref:Band 7 domain-containing protein n=1 Tax=Dovyalis caffra TaxID=77055 RepID=A0AAV1R011_9ROSI|nr:unnamed protein product [Dovyalis caffra]